MFLLVGTLGVALATESPPGESLEVSGIESAPAGTPPLSSAPAQTWNWHAQFTGIVQYHPHFAARYSGPNSLSQANEVKETVSLDLVAGVRLWPGAEAHIDGLMWQGFGLSKTLGVEGFPNGEAFRLGTDLPNLNIPRLFIRQTFGLGGEEENVADDALHLAGRQDVSRLTLTLGKMSARDIFDQNAFAGDPRTQFLNWALMANEAWDYPADSLGFITGLAAELNQPRWTLRYGFFQVPADANGVAIDPHYLDAWGMVAEFERRYELNGHPGAARLLAFLNRAHMGDYQAAADSPIPSATLALEATRAYRLKYGFGLNIEQEITTGLGAFLRLGWSEGRHEAWMFADVDHTATLGLSVNGAGWARPADTLGLAGILNGLSRPHRDYLAAGGTGILAGDGDLSYGLEKIVEVYYDFQIYKRLHGALDYQFISNPANNRDRGPVSVLGARLHWEL